MKNIQTMTVENPVIIRRFSLSNTIHEYHIENEGGETLFKDSSPIMAVQKAINGNCQIIRCSWETYHKAGRTTKIWATVANKYS